MMQRDDFEHRLGQGLKRWAQVGEPTIDLEALVRQRLERKAAAGAGAMEAAVQGVSSSAPGEALRDPTAARRRPRWFRWAAGAAVAASLLVALGATFPTWAGAAAGWPVVGPVVTEIIMKDAGLKWAYDMGLIEGNLAEAREGEIAVRILGVVADARRTTVLYQVTGLPTSDPDPSGRSGSGPGNRRPDLPVEAWITAVDGKGGVSFWYRPVATPLGWFGTVSTLPLERETAELTVAFAVAGKQLTMTVPASRTETDRFSREVAVNQSREIDGIRITVESVTYTPVETIVRYRIEAPSFNGPIQWEDGELRRLEVDGKAYRATGIDGGLNNRWHVAFPRVEGNARLVFPVEVKGVEIDAVWPLQEGAVAEVMGVPVTLTKYRRQGNVVDFTWENPDRDPFRGISTFEVIDASGKAYPLGTGRGGWVSTANNAHDGVRTQYYSAELPDGVEPVAVRATRAAVAVKGPWVFELPR